MTTELSSAKYLPAELTETLDYSTATGGVADPSKPLGGGYQPHRPTRKPSPGMISVIAVFLAIAGFIGILGGAFGALGQLGIDNMDTAKMTSAYRGQGHQAETYRRTIENRKRFSLVGYMHNGICVLVGFGFLASCFLLKANRPDANSFASTACIAAIFYNLLTIVVTWLTMPSLQGISGLSDEAASFAFVFAIGFTAVLTLMKIGLYTGIIAYMSSAGVKAAYQPQVEAAA